MAQKSSARSKRGDTKKNGAAPLRPKGDVQDKVYAELRRWLMIGHFLPGESITLRNLANELGVSPMPVRAALRHLIAEGGIEMLPNRTMRVPHMTLDRLMELLSLRRELEGMATAQACRNMTDADLRVIEKIHVENMRALKSSDGSRVLSLNQRFHFTIYALARSWVLLPMIEALWLRAGPFMHLAQMSPGVNWDGRHHMELMRALHRRDALAARRAIQRDINMAGQNLRKATVLHHPRGDVRIDRNKGMNVGKGGMLRPG
jgi:DNA-binding GntR family transcriptional regulator